MLSVTTNNGLTMLFESYFRDSHGNWRSAGAAECDPEQMLGFLQQDDGDPVRLRVASVSRENTLLVTVTRAIVVSGVETERNECLFASDAEAIDFEQTACDILAEAHPEK